MIRGAAGCDAGRRLVAGAPAAAPRRASPADAAERPAPRGMTVHSAEADFYTGARWSGGLGAYRAGARDPGRLTKRRCGPRSGLRVCEARPYLAQCSRHYRFGIYRGRADDPDDQPRHRRPVASGARQPHRGNSCFSGSKWWSLEEVAELPPSAPGAGGGFGSTGM